MRVGWNKYKYVFKETVPGTGDPIYDFEYPGWISGEVVATITAPWKAKELEPCFVVAMPDGTFETVAVTVCKKVSDE